MIGISRGSLVSQQGLRLNPNKAFGGGQCHWVITEVNHRPLNIVAADSEVGIHALFKVLFVSRQVLQIKQTRILTAFVEPIGCQVF